MTHCVSFKAIQHPKVDYHWSSMIIILGHSSQTTCHSRSMTFEDFIIPFLVTNEVQCHRLSQCSHSFGKCQPFDYHHVLNLLSNLWYFRMSTGAPGISFGKPNWRLTLLLACLSTLSKHIRKVVVLQSQKSSGKLCGTLLYASIKTGTKEKI